MSARKLDKLEQRLYRAIKDIREAPGPAELLDYLSKYSKLEHQYFKITGTRFNPVRDHAELQDVEWRY